MASTRSASAMVFAGPPEDDIDWADVSAAGSAQVPLRAWRLSGDVTSAPGVSPASGDAALRRAPHHALTEGAHAVESLPVQRRWSPESWSWSTHAQGDRQRGGAADPAVREAAEAVAIMLSLVAPYTAEEMWERLGHPPTVALAGWPAVDESLLVQETVTCVVQVAGKVRARLEVSPTAGDDELRELAIADEAVQRSLDGREIRTVIVRAPKLVNIVPA